MTYIDPLNKAVMKHDLASVTLMIKKGVDIEVKDIAGRTPLINAAIEDSIPIVKILLEHGANIETQDNNGYSALHFACQNQSIEMTKLLIEKGSQIDAVDAHGNTPLGRAVFNSHGRGEVIQLLLAAGADKTKKNNHGISPLDLAKSIANYDVKQFLE